MSESQVLRVGRSTATSSKHHTADAVLVYRVKSKKKKKKGTPGLRLIEKLFRRNASARATLATDYLDRHKRSSRKRRDGWLSDLPVNLFRSRRKSMKRLRLARLFF